MKGMEPAGQKKLWPFSQPEALPDCGTVRLISRAPGQAPLPWRGLSAGSVHLPSEKQLAWARIRGASFHDLRRTRITTLLPNNDGAIVAKIVSRSDPRTALRYDLRQTKARRTALGTMHVPCQPRTLHDR